MSVKGNSEFGADDGEPPGRRTEPSDDAPGAGERARGSDPPRSGLEADLGELLSVMPRVFRALRAERDKWEPGSRPKLDPRELFKQGGLGPRHIPVVVILMLDGPMTVSELARRLGLNLSTVSLMVTELAKAGLVERHEDEQDRRRTLVNVAERHRARFEPIVRERVEPLRNALERMPPEIRAAFLQGWRVLAEECEPPPPPAPPELPPGDTG